MTRRIWWFLGGVVEACRLLPGNVSTRLTERRTARVLKFEPMTDAKRRAWR